MTRWTLAPSFLLCVSAPQTVDGIKKLANAKLEAERSLQQSAMES